MKIAILSDIHGNYDALFEVLKVAKEEEVEHLLILGDVVGYYYYPDKILDLLGKWNFDIIKGNHEYILENLNNDLDLREKIRLKYGSGHQLAIEKLSNNQLNFLNTLPDTKTVKFDDKTFLMCHGSPWSNDFYIYPDSKKEIIIRCDSKKHDYVLIGHSHYSFSFINKNSILINPGSVGQSREKGGTAFWCVLDTIDEELKFIKTHYDTSKLLNEILKRDPDIKYLSSILKRN